MFRHHRLLVTLLILAAILFRGLIPTGYMPAVGSAAKPGAMLMPCHHGELMPMAAGQRGGHAAGHSTPEVCPFGAAVGLLALGLVRVVLALLAVCGRFCPRWASRTSESPEPCLGPPVRGPPPILLTPRRHALP